MWCHLPQQCLAGQMAQWVPVPAPTRQLEGQPRWWLPICTGDAKRLPAKSHTPFLASVWWRDYLEGLPSVARKPARLPCFWEVLNQNLPVRELLAPLFSSASEMPLNSSVFSLYWLTLKTSLRICTPSASFSWAEAVDGSVQHVQHLAPLVWLCFAMWITQLKVFESPKQLKNIFNRVDPQKTQKIQKRYCSINLPGTILYRVHIMRRLV